MVENDAIGSFGSFSAAGRNSAEKYKVIVYKDIILQGKDISSIKTEREEQRDEPIEDCLDIFEVDYNEKKEESNKQLRYRKCQSAKPPSERFKYYNKHRNEAKPHKKQIGPTCTKYNPKKDYTWNRSVSGTKWRTQSARIFHIKQDDTHYYLNHEAIIANKVGNTLIDMSKMTMRGEFTDVKDLRIKNIKPFCKSGSMKKMVLGSSLYSKSKCESRNNESKQMTLSDCQNNNQDTNKLLSQFRRKTMKKNCTSRPYSSMGTIRRTLKKQLNTSTSSLADSYDEYKHIYQKQIKKRTQSANVSKIRKKKTQIRAPDFKKAITRKHLDKLEDKSTLIPFSLPNFKLVRERPIMMVVYDQIRHKILKRKPMKAMDPNIDFNPDKYINRINNHSVASPPNFNLMSSRAINDDPLPLYMKNIYSRAAAYETTDLTLKMNNYAEGKFATQFSSFWPKKTFNKIINLNLLNSKQFLSNVMWKSDRGTDSMYKSMKFYRNIPFIILLLF